MPIITNKNKLTEESKTTFLAGSAYQSLRPLINTQEDCNKVIINLLLNKGVLPEDFERSINFQAFQILHYADSNWSNDYFDSLNTLAILAAHLPKPQFGTKENPVIMNPNYVKEWKKLHKKYGKEIS